MMNVLITGSTGLIGSAVARLLTEKGNQIRRMVRNAPHAPNEVRWNPTGPNLAPETLAGCEAVVHLAGESLAAGRWTEERKKRIYDSRIQGTRLLSESLARLAVPPRVLACASAIGYYGDRGGEILREESRAGSGFLAGLCHDWEAATSPAAAAGIRVVRLRIGVVLSAKGGALVKLLPPMRMGLGGKIGSGGQYWSWISLDDLAHVFLCALENEKLNGPVNAVAPQPVTNLEFTKTLGRVLGRPTLFPLPAFAARLALGQMADELLLASARVVPACLTAAGYTFAHPQLEGALRHVLA
jgi:uncharacterized protein (TIGR01777 family)